MGKIPQGVNPGKLPNGGDIDRATLSPYLDKLQGGSHPLGKRVADSPEALYLPASCSCAGNAEKPGWTLLRRVFPCRRRLPATRIEPGFSLTSAALPGRSVHSAFPACLASTGSTRDLIPIATPSRSRSCGVSSSGGVANEAGILARVNESSRVSPTIAGTSPVVAIGGLASCRGISEICMRLERCALMPSGPNDNSLAVSNGRSFGGWVHPDLRAAVRTRGVFVRRRPRAMFHIWPRKLTQ